MFGPAFAIAPDGEHVVVAGGQRCALFELATGREVRALARGGHAFAFLPDGRLAAAESNHVVIVDLASGAAIHEIRVPAPSNLMRYPTLRRLADPRRVAHACATGAMWVDADRGETIAAHAWPEGVVPGEWRRTASEEGHPTCLSPDDAGRAMTLGLVSDPGGSDRPASEVVAWLECALPADGQGS